MHWQTLGPRLPARDNPLLKVIGRSVFRGLGWQLEGEFPDLPKMVVAVAPHRSNMDFVLTLGVTYGLGLRASYLAKHTLFRPPLGAFMRMTGGIPVNRSAAHGLVAQLAAEFAARPQLVLGITPEGTRGRVREFKRGFALIAQAAEVPVLPAIIHAREKVVRLGPLIDQVQEVETVIGTVQALAEG